MRVIKGLENLGVYDEPAFLTLGAFDGVHRAHQELISRITTRASERDGISVLITFDPLPRSVIHGDDQGLVLTSAEHKKVILGKTGLDVVVILKFDSDFAKISAEDFLREVVLDHFTDIRRFVVGPRAHFGHKAEGNAEYLKQFGKVAGFKVEVLDELIIDDAVVSSSVIRKLVRAGELDTAAEFLGRRYSLYGTVVKGDRIGRKLGFPTANIDPHNEVYPPSGVYIVEARIGEESYPSVLNIGYRPTIQKRDDLQVAIEAHIMGFSGQIYGQMVEVVFHRKLRQEQHFAQTDELVDQIRSDISAACEYFEQKPQS